MAKSGENSKRLEDSVPLYGGILLVNKDERQALRDAFISFSFKHFRQTDFFGVGDCDSKWFVSLLERIKSVEGFTRKRLENESFGDKSLRFHPIDWGSKNCPISFNSLDWLPNEVKENPEEFPIMQIAVSTGTGRIIGYFDGAAPIFNIVLLDPKHNVQPSKDFGYQVNPTTFGLSQYDDLLGKIEEIKRLVASCPSTSCVSHEKIINACSKTNIIYVDLDDDFYEEYKTLIETHSLKEIFEAGILSKMK